MVKEIVKIKNFIIEIRDQNKLNELTFQEILEYIDKMTAEQELERKEKNRIAQRKYYKKNKEKVRKRNLEYYYKKKSNKDTSDFIETEHSSL